MKEANDLLKKYRAGECTPEELLLLKKWFHHLNEDEPKELTEEDFQVSRDLLRENMMALTKKSRISVLWPRLIAAASIILIAAAGLYFYKSSERTQIAKTEAKADVSPGGNKAILTLADGTKISLEDAKNGELAEQSGIKITKAADGQLIYTLSGSDDDSKTNSYNTIETPVGGQYQVNLPDGSKVWLNSASSLRYPVRFEDAERRVEIKGEAYFDVAHDSKKPFRVENNNQVVEVLGTEFNIMAYADENSIKTTLVEGSVKVIKANNSTTIIPGQQARMKDGKIDVVSVDTKTVTAWKSGFFIFKSEDIESIMRQISRWYNVDVKYEGDISRKTFGGKISRSKNISEVLAILELTGSIHFEIIPGDSPGKGRRIIVMP